MRNEEPTCTDPPPGFTGDVAADVGASPGWLWVHPGRPLEDPVEDRPGAGRGRELAAALPPGSEPGQGFVKLRRLYGHPC